jgi:mitochondrial fission protein ELM1
MPTPSVWVVSDGKTGTENQCLGLAEALGLPFTVKRLTPRGPWRWLPAGAWTPAPELALRTLIDATRDGIVPPWPGVVIANGRPSVGPALALRAKGARVVQLQDPRIAPSHFDLVVPPQHDHVVGPNVLSTLGTLNRITPEQLARAATRFAPSFAHLPRPLIAVLIGGSTVHQRMTTADVGSLVDRLLGLCRRENAGLIVTASRRTGAENMLLLQRRLVGPAIHLWDGTGDNPFLGILALADFIVVTADSASMASEAASTGKPVYVAELATGRPKFAEFHRSLRAAGITRPFDGGRLERWTYPPLRETARIAGEIKRRLGLPPHAPLA